MYSSIIPLYWALQSKDSWNGISLFLLFPLAVKMKELGFKILFIGQHRPQTQQLIH